MVHSISGRHHETRNEVLLIPRETDDNRGERRATVGTRKFSNRAFIVQEDREVPQSSSNSSSVGYSNEGFGVHLLSNEVGISAEHLMEDNPELEGTSRLMFGEHFNGNTAESANGEIHPGCSAEMIGEERNGDLCSELESDEDPNWSVPSSMSGDLFNDPLREQRIAKKKRRKESTKVKEPKSSRMALKQYALEVIFAHREELHCKEVASKQPIVRAQRRAIWDKILKEVESKYPFKVSGAKSLKTLWRKTLLKIRRTEKKYKRYATQTGNDATVERKRSFSDIEMKIYRWICSMASLEPIFLAEQRRLDRPSTAELLTNALQWRIDEDSARSHVSVFSTSRLRKEVREYALEVIFRHSEQLRPQNLVGNKWLAKRLPPALWNDVLREVSRKYPSTVISAKALRDVWRSTVLKMKRLKAAFNRPSIQMDNDASVGELPSLSGVEMKIFEWVCSAPGIETTLNDRENWPYLQNGDLGSTSVAPLALDARSLGEVTAKEAARIVQSGSGMHSENKVLTTHNEHRIARKLTNNFTDIVINLVDAQRCVFGVTFPHESGKTATVQRITSVCPKDVFSCRLRCKYASCGGCVHMFTCTCWRSADNGGVLCRHCHAVLPLTRAFLNVSLDTSREEGIPAEVVMVREGDIRAEEDLNRGGGRGEGIRAKDIMVREEDVQVEEVMVREKSIRAEELLVRKQSIRAEEVEDIRNEEVVIRKEGIRAEEIMVREDGIRTEEVIVRAEGIRADEIVIREEGIQAEDIMVKEEGIRGEEVISRTEGSRANEIVITEEGIRAEEIMVKEEGIRAEEVVARTEDSRANEVVIAAEGIPAEELMVKEGGVRAERVIARTEGIGAHKTVVREEGIRAEEVEDIRDEEVMIREEGIRAEEVMVREEGIGDGEVIARREGFRPNEVVIREEGVRAEEIMVREESIEAEGFIARGEGIRAGEAIVREEGILAEDGAEEVMLREKSIRAEEVMSGEESVRAEDVMVDGEEEQDRADADAVNGGLVHQPTAVSERSAAVRVQNAGCAEDAGQRMPLFANISQSVLTTCGSSGSITAMTSRNGSTVNQILIEGPVAISVHTGRDGEAISNSSFAKNQLNDSPDCSKSDFQLARQELIRILQDRRLSNLSEEEKRGVTDKFNEISEALRSYINATRKRPVVPTVFLHSSSGVNSTISLATIGKVTCIRLK
ncbi:Cardiomyopathy-associated protein 5 [Toxocara canis]|uniref:Cardiomyopathy-associated protein 5 n=1 Tax=Toxocara canis TaxID=6265 RepID=A0A0B2VM57_TOXCA|nr:Cardiomyopathy-associated protein 5 [Toxocara canis]